MSANSYWVVDDFGRVINSTMTDGQVHGEIVQGLGQILFENISHEEGSGQLLTASFSDYCMPHAHDVPPLFVETNEVLAKTNPLGIKGAGEAGCVGALPAIMNAINDALSPLGLQFNDMPATSERIWHCLQKSR